MKRILLSVIVALGVHGWLLSADFNLPWSSLNPIDIPDRITVVMVSAPLPSKMPLPAPSPPPDPQLLVKNDIARVPDELPKTIPETVPDRSRVPTCLLPHEMTRLAWYRATMILP